MTQLRLPAPVPGPKGWSVDRFTTPWGTMAVRSRRLPDGHVTVIASLERGPIWHVSIAIGVHRPTDKQIEELRAEIGIEPGGWVEVQSRAALATVPHVRHFQVDASRGAPFGPPLPTVGDA